MAKNKKNTSLFLSFLAVVLVAVIAGYGITRLQQSTTNEDPNLTSPQTAQEKQKQKELKNADYLISRPSQGSLIQKQKITITYHPNDQASVLLPLPHSEKIHLYQDIILYDKAKTTMPLGGKIKSITPAGDMLDIKISLPTGTKTEYLSNDADIITLDARSSLRFPLKALQQDKNANYYVWAAEKTEKEGLFKAIQVWVQSPLIGEKNFVAGIKISVNSFLVLEPNKKIKHNDTYKMVEVQYKAPYHNPIKQAYYDYHSQKRRTDMVDAKQRLADCREDARKDAEQKKQYGTTGGQSGSCGNGTVNGKADPMDIFNSILSRQPSAKKKAGSCGGGAPSCATP